MTHIEYLDALKERLEALDGKTVNGGSGSAAQPSQSFDQNVERAVERIIRKRAPL